MPRVTFLRSLICPEKIKSNPDQHLPKAIITGDVKRDLMIHHILKDLFFDLSLQLPILRKHGYFPVALEGVEGGEGWAKFISWKISFIIYFNINHYDWVGKKLTFIQLVNSFFIHSRCRSVSCLCLGAWDVCLEVACYL